MEEGTMREMRSSFRDALLFSTELSGVTFFTAIPVAVLQSFGLYRIALISGRN
uniref:hypothetical protein n=1 Tax=Ochrobactrum sp. LM19 TaxID=1449781 RepID=UPI001AEE571D|nr:hypothetical protein [Ochrobactrum sp. LM19]